MELFAVARVLGGFRIAQQLERLNLGEGRGGDRRDLSPGCDVPVDLAGAGEISRQEVDDGLSSRILVAEARAVVRANGSCRGGRLDWGWKPNRFQGTVYSSHHDLPVATRPDVTRIAFAVVAGLTDTGRDDHRDELRVLRRVDVLRLFDRDHREIAVHPRLGAEDRRHGCKIEVLPQRLVVILRRTQPCTDQSDGVTPGLLLGSGEAGVDLLLLSDGWPGGGAETDCQRQRSAQQG